MFSTLGSILSSGSKAYTLGNRFPQCVIFDFTDTHYFASTGKLGSLYIRDTTTPGNNYKGPPIDKLSITRASNAAFVNANGVMSFANSNVLRFNYHPTTRSLQGILLEPASNNLFIQSQNLVAWTTYRTTVANTVIPGPDGVSTFNKLIPDANNSVHTVSQIRASTINTNQYTGSIFAKAGEYTVMDFYIYEGTTFSRTIGARFNLSNGAITSPAGYNGANLIHFGTENWGNGVYRCWLSGNWGGTDTSLQIQLLPVSGSSSTLIGNGTDGFYAGFAQLEAGSSLTTYIPTVASSVARNGDALYALTSAFPFITNQGTIFIESTVLSQYYQSIVNLGSLCLRNTPGTERISTGRYVLGPSPTVPYIDSVIFANGAPQADTDNTLFTYGQSVKSALAYRTNNVRPCVNGVLGAGDTSAVMPSSLTHMYFGVPAAVGGNITTYGSMYIKKVIYLPTDLSNNELMALTR